MGANSKIEWCHHTFNPWVGCTKISPACDHCYAESWAKRSGMVQWGPGAARRRTSDAYWRQPLKWDREAEKNGTSPRVFCASLADVFDNEVPEEWRRDLFKLIAATPNLDWLILTKRIGNVIRMLWDMADNRRPSSHAGDLMAHHWRNDRAPGHVWLGATICNQDEADRDILKLLAIPAAMHFVSIEPMLGPVYIGHHLPNPLWSSFPGPSLDWVISGGESGPAARPSHPDWFRSLRDQCAVAGVPYLHKQNGEWVSASEVSGPGRHYTFSDGATVRRVGKKLAGRAIDGVVHDGFPALPA